MLRRRRSVLRPPRSGEALRVTGPGNANRRARSGLTTAVRKRSNPNASMGPPTEVLQDAVARRAAVTRRDESVVGLELAPHVGEHRVLQRRKPAMRSSLPLLAAVILAGCGTSVETASFWDKSPQAGAA